MSTQTVIPTAARTTDRSWQLALAAAQAAADNRGHHITVLDMREQTPIFDYFLMVTGTSRRQLRAISDAIERKLELELHDKRMSIDGYDESRWIVLDFGTLVAHIFDAETRQYYSLENLWADAKPVDLSGWLPPEALAQDADPDRTYSRSRLAR